MSQNCNTRGAATESAAVAPYLVLTKPGSLEINLVKRSAYP